MNVKPVIWSALFLSLLVRTPVRAQDQSPSNPGYAPTVGGTGPALSAMLDEPPPPDPVELRALSSWITYGRPLCCGPAGRDGWIGSELYVRTGPTLPVAGDVLGHTLEMGWEVQAGGRTLFFNVPHDRAWVIDLGASYLYNNGNRPNFVLQVDENRVSVQALHRAYADFGFGREYYLFAPVAAFDCTWRLGWDVGGRWGTARLDLNNLTNTSGFSRRNEVIGAVDLAVHADVEIPCGCGCTFFGGLRAEWDYTWMDILPGNSDLMGVNLLLNAGVRF